MEMHITENGYSTTTPVAEIFLQSWAGENSKKN